MPTITPPSKLERLARGSGYIVVGLCGPVVLLAPPETLAPALGYLMVMWCIFMATGIVAGTAAILGRFRTEYVMLPFLTGAVLIADANLFFRAFTGEPDVLTRALIVAGLVLIYIARWITLNRLVKIGTSLQNRGRRWLGGLHPWTGTK